MTTSNSFQISDKTADFLQRQHAMLIGGQWLPAADGNYLPVFNPTTGKQISQIPAGKAVDIDRAVTAARQAYDGEWGRVPPIERQRLLLRLADLIEAHGDELAELDYLDNGKPLHLFVNGDVPSAVQTLRYYAGWATKINGITTESAMGKDGVSYTLREPLGVAGMITPWNVPLIMVAWKLAPALAAGCSCVFKPAEDTSLSALRAGELVQAAGFPDGAVNIVTGLGHEAGSALAAHPQVDKIAFTGSVETGRKIVQGALGNLKKVSLELGGKSPSLIFADADLEKAIPQAAMSVFYNSGQICIAGARLYIHEKVYDQVVAGIAEFAKSLKLSSGNDPRAFLGPLINERQLNRVSGYVEGGVRDGAEVVTGGVREGDTGWFYTPTVMVGANDDMAICREEIFGPVLMAQPFSDTDEVIRRANDTTYGLYARAWTRDLSRAHRLITALKAGTVTINGGGPGDANVPFGGYRQSGWGRELGRDGLELYLQTKAVQIALN